MTRRLALSAVALAQIVSAHAISINVQYQNGADPFFTPAARATLQQAANDIGFAIRTSLAPLTKNSYTGTNGSTTSTVTWSYSYTNPATGNPAPDITTFDFLPDEFRIFVGSRSLGGSTLGIGGPGGIGFETSGGGQSNRWTGAVANMQAASNASMPRGGPALGNFQGTTTLGNTTANYSLDYGHAVGSLSFDSTSNWHFDYATLPASRQNDFYSVAVHEILHSIGFVTGESFQALASGTDWLGPAVLNLRGSGTNVLAPDQAHVRSSLAGSPIIDGVYRSDLTQEAAMDPTLTTGTRKYITDLDLAFLSDMGWQTVAVPEPATWALLILAALAAWGARASSSHLRASSPKDRP